MALPLVDQHGCDRLPPDHSVEDHLEAERAALHAERWAAVDRTVRRNRWMMIRAAGLGFALAGTIALGWRQAQPTDDGRTACAPTDDAADTNC